MRKWMNIEYDKEEEISLIQSEGPHLQFMCQSQSDSIWESTISKPPHRGRFAKKIRCESNRRHRWISQWMNRTNLSICWPCASGAHPTHRINRFLLHLRHWMEAQREVGRDLRGKADGVDASFRHHSLICKLPQSSLKCNVQCTPFLSRYRNFRRTRNLNTTSFFSAPEKPFTLLTTYIFSTFYYVANIERCALSIIWFCFLSSIQHTIACLRWKLWCGLSPWRLQTFAPGSIRITIYYQIYCSLQSRKQRMSPRRPVWSGNPIWRRFTLFTLEIQEMRE